MTENPYSSPISESQAVTRTAPDSDRQSLGDIAKNVFLAWERLRIAYIILLGLFTALIAAPTMTEPRTILLIVEGAVIANVCFFAGPAVETYVRWLGYDRDWVRKFLFAGGTLFTMLLVLFTFASQFIPNQQ